MAPSRRVIPNGIRIRTTIPSSYPCALAVVRALAHTDNNPRTGEKCACAMAGSATAERIMLRDAYDASEKHRFGGAAALRAGGTNRTKDEQLAAMDAELLRSLRDYRKDPVKDVKVAEKELRRPLSSGDRNWVLVYENRVFVSSHYETRAKHGPHAIMMKDVADWLGLPNALYSVATETEGPKNCGAVTLTVNKQLGYAQCGVLIPNTYFGDGNLTSWAREIAREPPLPWKGRTAKALYRGSLTHPRVETSLHCATVSYAGAAPKL